MESKVADFIAEMQTPVKRMSISKLRDREETWRALWSWLPDNVKYLIYRIGSTVRILRRDYKGSYGVLGEVKFEPSVYEIEVYEKKYNETDGKFWLEKKIIQIPESTVMMLEFIMDRELAEEADKLEVMGLEGVAEPT